MERMGCMNIQNPPQMGTPVQEQQPQQKQPSDRPFKCDQCPQSEPRYRYELPVRKNQAVLNFGILEDNCSSWTWSFKYSRPPSIRPKPAKYYVVFYSIK